MTRIIFMGTPDYAADILKTLIATDDIDVVAVYTQPDKPVGRKGILTPPAVKVLAQETHIPIMQPSRLRDEKVVEELLHIKCDLIIVAAYGQILPKAILEHAMCINLHASILPQYRGASPIQQSLLHNDTKSGVTAMLMDEGLDTGAIIKIVTVEISPDEMVTTLYDSLATIACDLTVDVIRNWDQKTILPQNDKEATYCSKISKSDGLIGFENAVDIYNKYRAFTPWPGVYLESGLKLKEMELIESQSQGAAGKIVATDLDGIVVQCNQGSLRLIKLQAPSKQETSAIAYLNGKRIGCGNTLV